MTTITSRPTEPLRLEHRELLPRIDAIRDLADAVGTAGDQELRSAGSSAHAFLAHHLVPHARAEEAVLYPAVEAAMGAPGATDTMHREHIEVVKLIDDLARELADRAPIDADRARRLRTLLYGLHAIVALHFAKEEELYLEILDRSLDERSSRQLFERLEAAAAAAKSEVTA